MQKLPKILEREPLVDAVFEVRLNGPLTLADILPGFLFHDLEPKPTVKRLPAAEIPQPMRANDPELQFVPVLRLEWSDYIIAVGDRNFVISCRLPYPKWPKFKSAILDITGRIANVGISGQVERYSLKYVNLIEAATLAEQFSKIKMSITLGAIEVEADQVNLKVHRKEADVVHILSLITGASGKRADGKEMSGVVVDIDSIRNMEAPDFAAFAAELGPGLEELRQANKAKFFGCLTEATIEEMGPIYD
jgi:uncharacterized protein (TIGR04255 family)